MARFHPMEKFIEARQMASENGCFVVEKGERFLVFRRTPGGNVFLGSRGSQSGLCAFVRKVTNFN